MESCRIRVFALVLVCLSTLSTVASAKQSGVAVAYRYENGCVQNIYVSALEEDDGLKETFFDPVKHRLRLGNSKVEWTLVPLGAKATGVTWSIYKTAGNYENCPDSIPFSGKKAKCNVKNKGIGERTWTYTVKAVKDDCDPASVDPEIIFEKGSEGFTFGFLFSLLLLALIPGGGAYYGYRRLRAQKG